MISLIKGTDKTGVTNQSMSKVKIDNAIATITETQKLKQKSQFNILAILKLAMLSILSRNVYLSSDIFAASTIKLASKVTITI